MDIELWTIVNAGDIIVGDIFEVLMSNINLKILDVGDIKGHMSRGHLTIVNSEFRLYQMMKLLQEKLGSMSTCQKSRFDNKDMISY